MAYNRKDLWWSEYKEMEDNIAKFGKEVCTEAFLKSIGSAAKAHEQNITEMVTVEAIVAALLDAWGAER